jgi:hypothetical protein
VDETVSGSGTGQRLERAAETVELSKLDFPTGTDLPLMTSVIGYCEHDSGPAAVVEIEDEASRTRRDKTGNVDK